MRGHLHFVSTVWIKLLYHLFFFLKLPNSFGPYTDQKEHQCAGMDHRSKNHVPCHQKRIPILVSCHPQSVITFSSSLTFAPKANPSACTRTLDPTPTHTNLGTLLSYPIYHPSLYLASSKIDTDYFPLKHKHIQVPFTLKEKKRGREWGRHFIYLCLPHALSALTIS